VQIETRLFVPAKPSLLRCDTERGWRLCGSWMEYQCEGGGHGATAMFRRSPARGLILAASNSILSIIKLHLQRIFFEKYY
jgi:hypothetical protein